METFKEIVAYLLSPLCIAIIIFGFGWGLAALGKPKASRYVLLAATVFLLVGSMSGWSYGIRQSREYTHSPLGVADIQQLVVDRSAIQRDDPAENTDKSSLQQADESQVLIVVLGCGYTDDDDLPANSRVPLVFLSRLIEGVRVHRSIPGSRLVVSVSGNADVMTKTQFITEMSELLALDEDMIDIIFDAESTADEAQSVAEGYSSERVIVVTSAGHMNRSIDTFKDYNIKAIPSPTDYMCERPGHESNRAWMKWVPSTEGIRDNHQFLYETVAGIWQNAQ